MHSGATPGGAVLNQAVLSKVSHPSKPDECTMYARLVYDYENQSLKQTLLLGARAPKQTQRA